MVVVCCFKYDVGVQTALFCLTAVPLTKTLTNVASSLKAEQFHPPHCVSRTRPNMGKIFTSCTDHVKWAKYTLLYPLPRRQEQLCLTKTRRPVTMELMDVKNLLCVSVSAAKGRDKAPPKLLHELEWELALMPYYISLCCCNINVFFQVRKLSSNGG